LNVYIDIHATYTRLIPKIKKIYDYGVMIFLLTFKLFFDALDTCLFVFFLYLPCGFQIRIWNIVNEHVGRDVELGSYFLFTSLLNSHVDLKS
jgi:hypothetical protein